MPKGMHSVPKVYPDFMVEEVRRLYWDEGKSQAEVADEMRTSQKVVCRLMNNHNIPRRPQVKRDQVGPANDSWKGDDAGYAAMHKRVEAVRGRPLACALCDKTGVDRYEWANLTGNYVDPRDYVRACVSCHRQLDARRRARRKAGDATC